MVWKTYIFIVIFILSFTLLPSTAIAQTTSATLKEQRKETVQERREATKEPMQERREVVKEKREAFKQKLTTIRDEKKKVVVERLDNKLSMVNEKRTNRMSEYLEKLSSILTKIKERAALAKTNGKDTNTVDTAIATAEASLANAESAVVTQAAKEYIITIGSEKTLKTTVGTTTSKLQSDLQITHKAVVAAKQAVQAAARSAL